MKIRLIWDFFGPDAPGTAAHHQIHLHELFSKESIDCSAYGVGSAAQNHAMSWCEVDQEDADAISKALKPQRRADEPNFDKIEWTLPDEE